jgi:hypothetical protein
VAGVYKVAVRIVVLKGDPGETFQDEEFFFVDMSFSRMSHVSDGLYELLAKLQKEK